MLRLKEILKKEPSDLSEAEKAFLQASVEKLSDEQKTKFAEILKDESGESGEGSGEGEGEEGEGDEEKGLSLDEVKALISKNVQEAISQKVDKISDDLAAKFLAGVSDQRKKAIDGKKVVRDAKADDVTRKFMKALINGDKMAAKALNTHTTGASPDDADAGLLIPTELLTEVLRIIPQYGVARRLMRYLPFSGPGNSRTIPALGTSVSVYWTGEGAKKKSTQPKFSLVTQTLKKLAAIVPFTEEILEDSAINLTQLVSQLLAEAVGVEEDLQFLAGTGSPWTGVLNNGFVNQVRQASGDASQLTADDLLDMIDKTPTGALNGSRFIFHRTVLSAVRKLKDSTGQYIWQRPQDGQPGTIWDYPYETTDAMPALADVEEDDPYIIFGNLQTAAILGDKQQLRVKLLEEATITDTDDSTAINLAEQDMVALRIVERVGYVLAVPKAVTVLVAQAHQS